MGLTSSLRMYHQLVQRTVEVHWHDFYEMSFFLAGSGTHILNGASHRLQAGSIFLLTPADFHAVIPDSGAPLELFNIIFSSNLLRMDVYQLLFDDLKVYMTDVSGQSFAALEAEFRRLWQEVNEPRVGQHLVIQHTLERILIDLARSCQTGEADEARQEGQKDIHNALVYIHHHFREPLTLEDAARQACLSPNYFSESFRKLSGTSFQSYLQNLRLQFAGSLLSSSNLSITDVCYASGFNTLSHFERAFKQKYGTAPRRFQNRRD